MTTVLDEVLPMLPSRVTRFATLLAVMALALSVAPTAARGPRPANDDRAKAISVAALPFSATVDVSRITRSLDDPGPSCFNGGTVWYSFTSTDRRMLTVSSMGSEIPAGVEVYRVSDGGLQLVTCAYDFMTFASELQVDPATTYLIMAGPTSASATRGTIKLTVDTYGTPPAHDVKAGALAITPGTTLVSDSTAGTTDPDDFADYASGRATMWHRFVATSDGRYGASVHPTGFEPALNVGEQTPAGIVRLGFIGGSDVPTIFEVTAGRTYYLLVGSATGGRGGAYSVTLTSMPRIHPTLTIDSVGTVDRTSGAVGVTGTATCSVPANLSIGVVVTQREARGSGFPQAPVSCGSVPVSWSASILPESGAFEPGPADALAGGTASTQFDYDYAQEATASVSLRGQ